MTTSSPSTSIVNPPNFNEDEEIAFIIGVEGEDPAFVNACPSMSLLQLRTVIKDQLDLDFQYAFTRKIEY